jgi:hypothetical protein
MEKFIILAWNIQETSSVRELYQSDFGEYFPATTLRVPNNKWRWSVSLPNSNLFANGTADSKELAMSLADKTLLDFNSLNIKVVLLTDKLKAMI